MTKAPLIAMNNNDMPTFSDSPASMGVNNINGTMTMS